MNNLVVFKLIISLLFAIVYKVNTVQITKFLHFGMFNLTVK